MPSGPAKVGKWRAFLEKAAFASKGTLFENTRVDIHVDAPEFVPRMLEAMERAEKSITFQYFGIEADSGGEPFLDQLIAAARRGVTVKVILDSVEMFLETNGKWNFLPFRSAEVSRERSKTRKMLREMEQAGADFFRYGWRYKLNRNHSKSLIVDNAVLFVGGFNPTAHNCEWHEVCAEISGPIVLEGQRRFNDIFTLAGRAGAPLDPPPSQNEMAPGTTCTAALISQQPKRHYGSMKDFMVAAIDEAESSIRIENGYVMHPDILHPLIEAAKRGVSVSLVAPSKSNHATVDRGFQKWFPHLTKAGVSIYLYPGMTHAKVISFDDMLVSIGSTNLERWSLERQNELNLIAVDANGELAKTLRDRVFEPDQAKSKHLGGSFLPHKKAVAARVG